MFMAWVLLSYNVIYKKKKEKILQFVVIFQSCNYTNFSNHIIMKLMHQSDICFVRLANTIERIGLPLYFVHRYINVKLVSCKSFVRARTCSL